MKVKSENEIKDFKQTKVKVKTGRKNVESDYLDIKIKQVQSNNTEP